VDTSSASSTAIDDDHHKPAVPNVRGIGLTSTDGDVDVDVDER
jgi:hypothetical protein